MSYLRSCLTTQALLRGAGVGNADASPVMAAIAWVMRDGVGMVASLLLAYHFSASFDENVKEWRLMADVLNNMGLFVNMLVSIFPQHFMLLGCFSAVCYACCGLIAGSTRARISAHFVMPAAAAPPTGKKAEASRLSNREHSTDGSNSGGAASASAGQLADVTAKESTQETAVTLVGLVLGMMFTQFVADNVVHAWAGFLLLTAVHQWANFNLVRVLVFDTINQQRAYILAERCLRDSEGSTSEDKSSQESSQRAILDGEDDGGRSTGVRRRRSGRIRAIAPSTGRSDGRGANKTKAAAVVGRRRFVFPSPAAVASMESLLRPWYLARYGPQLGVSVRSIYAAIEEAYKVGPVCCGEGKRAGVDAPGVDDVFARVLDAWASEPFIVAMDARGRVAVSLHASISNVDTLRAYFVALFVHHQWRKSRGICRGDGGGGEVREFYDAYCGSSAVDGSKLQLSNIVLESNQWYSEQIEPNFSSSSEMLGGFGAWDVSEESTRLHTATTARYC